MSKMNPKTELKGGPLKTISVKLESGASSSSQRANILTIPSNSPLIKVKLKREGGQLKPVFPSVSNSPNSPVNVKLKRASVVGQALNMNNPSNFITIKRDPGKNNAVTFSSVMPQTKIVNKPSNIVTIKRQPGSSVPIILRSPTVQNVNATNKESKYVTFYKQQSSQSSVKASSSASTSAVQIEQKQIVGNPPKLMTYTHNKQQQQPIRTVKTPTVAIKQTTNTPPKLMTYTHNKQQQQPIRTVKTPTVAIKQTTNTPQPQASLNPNRYILLNSTETDYDNFRFVVDGVEYRIVREDKLIKKRHQHKKRQDVHEQQLHVQEQQLHVDEQQLHMDEEQLNEHENAEIKCEKVQEEEEEELTYDEQNVSEESITEPKQEIEEHIGEETVEEECVGEETVDNDGFDNVGEELVYEEDGEEQEMYTVSEIKKGGRVEKIVWGIKSGNGDVAPVDPLKAKVEEPMMTDDHRDDDGEPQIFYYCDICGKSFKSVRSVNIHMKRSHNVCSSKIAKCKPVKKTDRERSLQEKKFVCDTCGKKFGSNAFLKYHQRTHTGEKPYQCQYCPKRFGMPVFLQIHTRTHTGERPYPCEICNKGFISKPALLRHHMVHTGEKPYKCPECGKAFTQSNSMKLHVHTVHLKLPSPYKSTARKKKEALAMQKLTALKQAAESITDDNQVEEQYSDEDDEGNDDEEMEEVPW